MHIQAHSRIEEGRFVSIRGVDQWVTVRGRDQGNTPLLILPGPGAGFSVLAPLFAPWEHAFTLVQWDQPHAGVTHARHGGNTPGAYTIERLVADGLAVCAWATRRLGISRIAVLAFSAGTILGLHMIKRCPELFRAYVATGQITRWARQDALSYRMVLAAARQRHDAAAIAELERIGPPPYADTATDAIKAKYSVAPTAAEAAAFAALPAPTLAAMTDAPADAGYVPSRWLPQKDARAVATAAYDALRPELLSFDAAPLGPAFEVPMIFLQGELDACTVSAEVEQYAATIRAPHKKYVGIPDAGHSPWMMRERYLQLLDLHVRPLLSEDR